MKMLGTAINDEFSDVDETGILVCYDEMYPEKRDRHAFSGLGDWMKRVRARFPHLRSEDVEKLHERRQKRRRRIFERFKKRIGKQEK